jgi:DNA repair protein RecO (recombination protein O)
MQWDDVGLVLALRPHGEAGAVVSMLTARHGRHAGLARSVRGKTQRGTYEPGNLLALIWRSRQAENLGQWAAEIHRAYAATAMADPDALGIVTSVCALCDLVLPERLAVPALFDATVAMLDRLGSTDAMAAYAGWELTLLAELGYGLDLTRCAATGTHAELIYVSPRSGRAVSRQAGTALAGKLLPLPGFLIGTDQPTPAAIVQALTLTGYFLETQALLPQGGRLPAARHRLLDRAARAATISG